MIFGDIILTHKKQKKLEACIVWCMQIVDMHQYFEPQTFGLEFL